MGFLFGSWTLLSSERSARLSAAPRSRCGLPPLQCLTQYFIPSGAASPSSSTFPWALPCHRMAVVLELPLLWHHSPSHLPSALRSPWPVTSPRNLLVSFTDFTALDCSSVLNLPASHQPGSCSGARMPLPRVYWYVPRGLSA